MASLCSDQLCGKAEGIRLGTQMKDSISRRRCHKLKPQVQNKKFTNRTYLPTRDGHKDAFDMEFALPRLGELLEQSYNKLSLSSPENPGMCQATLGLGKHGGPETCFVSEGGDAIGDRRVWDGKTFKWRKAPGSVVNAVTRLFPTSLHKARTCCIKTPMNAKKLHYVNSKGDANKCTIEMSSMMVDEEAVFAQKVLRSNANQTKTIFGCSRPEHGMPEHGHILRIQACGIMQYPICVLLKLTKAADAKRTSNIVQGFAVVLPFPGAMQFANCKVIS